MPFFGVLLASGANLFEEISASIGKNEAAKGRESIFVLGFIQSLSSTILIGLILLLAFDSWRFNPASLPTLIPRMILEIGQIYFTLQALERSDRTTFSFFRIGTVPLLLGVDLLLGFKIEINQMIGMIILMGIFAFIFLKKVVSRRGLGFVIFSTVNAVITISLYKYDIANFNSVATEQFIYLLLMTLFCYFMVKIKTKEKPSQLFFKRAELGESLSMAIGSILSSYAYVFAPPSVIITAGRAASVFWSTLSGFFFFKEDHKKQKAFTAFLLVMVLVLLAK